MLTRFTQLTFLVSFTSIAFSQSPAQDAITISADKVTIRNKGQLSKIKQGKQNGSFQTLGLDITDPADHVQLGYGYDVFSGEIIPTKCAEGNALPDVVSGEQRADPSTAIRAVTTLTEMRNASGTSAEASLTYKAFSVGYAGSQYRQDYFRSYYGYVVTNLKVVNKTETFEPQRLAPNGKTALAQKRFGKVCGQMYVLAIEKGALLKSTAVAATKTSGSASNSEQEVKAGIAKLIGLKGSSTEAMSKITDNSSLTLDNVQRGAKRDPTAALDEMIQYAYKYPTLAEGADAQVGFKLAAYDRLPSASAAGVEGVPNETLTAIGTLADRRDDAAQQRNDLRFAKGNTGVYTIDETARLKELKETTDYLTSISAVVDACQAKPKECKAAIDKIGDVPATTLKRVATP